MTFTTKVDSESYFMYHWLRHEAQKTINSIPKHLMLRGEHFHLENEKLRHECPVETRKDPLGKEHLKEVEDV